MNTRLQCTLALSVLALATQAAAQIRFYENDNYGGRLFTASQQVDDLSRAGFNDRASSVVVDSGRWEVCDDSRLRGRCVVLRVGGYASLSALGLNDRISSVRPVSMTGRYNNEAPPPAPIAANGTPQITFYEGDGYRGRAFTANKQVDDFSSAGFNDRASSVVVDGGRWEVCEDARLRGRCVVLRPGSYESLTALGMDNRISSVRPMNFNGRYANEAPQPVAAPNYAWRRRANEQVYEAPVTSVRAVVGPPNERCWMERQQVSEPARNPNMGGAIVGGLIGGILGHQVGGGSGRDIATAGGAVAGAVIGSKAGGGNASSTQDREVKRCETTASTTPAYWDVTYNYRGQDHHLQMTTAPGATIAVNRDGEPRQ